MPKDKLVAIPEAAADRFELDSAEYKDGNIHLQSTVKIPANDRIGPDAAEILDMVAKADDDRVFTKSEVKAILIKTGFAVAKHYGAGNLLG